MEKLGVSIIGSCVTREIFNDPRMQEVFKIDLYAFKACPWALFDEGLDIPEDLIFRASNPGSLNKMLNYELNKLVVKEIDKAKSEILFVDMYAVLEKIYFITYNNKSTYIQFQSCYNTLKNFINSLDNDKQCFFEIKEMHLTDIDKGIVLNGLDKFATWANLNFKKVVLSVPIFANKFISFDGAIKNYSTSYDERLDILNYYTGYFASKLNENKCLLEWKQDYVARVYYDDFLHVNNYNYEPNKVHIINACLEDLVDRLFEMLNINYMDYYNKELEYKSYKFERLQLETSKYRALVEHLKRNILCNLCNYTKWLKTLQHHLIVIAAKDEASRLLKNYFNKSVLGLDFNINFRDSYIAIIDTKNDFKYENSSHYEIEKIYEIPDTSEAIYINSCGFDAGSRSNIIFQNLDRSKNQRGLNFVVIDLENMSVLDRASCDLNNDEFLLVNSEFFSSFTK